MLSPPYIYIEREIRDTPDGINKVTPTKDAQVFAYPGSCFLAPPISAVVLTSNTGDCENTHSSREEDRWEMHHSRHQIGGWRAVFAAGLQGKGCYKRSVCFTDTSIIQPFC